MLRSKSLFLISIFIFLLSGCEKLGSFSVSTDKSKTASSDQSKSLSSDQSINSSNSSRASVKIPAAALIADSVSEYLAQEGFKPPYRRSFTQSDSLTLSAPHRIEGDRPTVAAVLV